MKQARQIFFIPLFIAILGLVLTVAWLRNSWQDHYQQEEHDIRNAIYQSAVPIDLALGEITKLAEKIHELPPNQHNAFFDAQTYQMVLNILPLDSRMDILQGARLDCSALQQQIGHENCLTLRRTIQKRRQAGETLALSPVLAVQDAKYATLLIGQQDEFGVDTGEIVITFSIDNLSKWWNVSDLSPQSEMLLLRRDHSVWLGSTNLSNLQLQKLFLSLDLAEGQQSDIQKVMIAQSDQSTKTYMIGWRQNEFLDLTSLIIVPLEGLFIDWFQSIFWNLTGVLCFLFIVTIILFRLLKSMQLHLLKRHDAELELSSTFKVMPDLFALLNQNGQLIRLNPAWHQLLGWTEEELLGTQLREFYHSEDKARTVNTWYDGLKKHGYVKDLECRVLGKDGSEHWIQWSGTYAANKQMIVVARDVTQSRQLQEKLETSAYEAQQANMAKSKFLANVSHELRTPLNAILGFSQILKDQVFGDLGGEKNESFVEDIHDAGQILLDVIEDILDVSRIEFDATKLTPSRFDLRTAVEDNIKLHDRMNPRPDLRFEVNLSDTPIILETDRKAVSHILRHLLSNAIKFTEKGTITVTAAQLDTGAILHIKDTGSGIPEDHLAKVSTPFYQVENHLTRKHDGVGVGLTIVRGLCHAIGAEMSLESQEGIGTEISISFKIPKEKATEKVA